MTLWVADLTDKNVSPSSVGTFVAAIKKAVTEGTLPGDSKALLDSPLLKDMLKGHARTFKKPQSSRSISAPFKNSAFQAMMSEYRRIHNGSLRTRPYMDALVLAAMSLGLGGCLRPNEYLKTNPTQRVEAILTIDHVRLYHVDHGPEAPIPGDAIQDLLNHDAFGPGLKKVEVFLTCSKTDKTKQGEVVTIDDPVFIHHIASYLSLRPRRDAAGQDLEPLLLDIINSVPQQLTNQHFSGYMRTFMARYGVKDVHNYTPKSLRSGAAESISQGAARKLRKKIILKGRWTNFNTPSNSYLNRPSSSW